ncbi:hypothetical protein OUZ56_003630 [Daphnia magna]|uniref:Uncharacterized protein n=1 Tax=Daphnia magna TaxID=35525 RepID=A0ABR0A9A1_9CRUS|nr:hypothetical protein OUZ56_003630 [Daphnia magna]
MSPQCSVAWEDDGMTGLIEEGDLEKPFIWLRRDVGVYSEPGSRESLRKQQVVSGDSLKPLFPLSIKHADDGVRILHNALYDNELLSEGFTGPLVLDENVNYYGSLADQGPVTDVKEVYDYLP